MLKQGLEDEIKVAKKQLGESQLTRSATEEELHGAEAALSETQKTLATDTKYLEELKQSCETKVAQRIFLMRWTVLTKDRYSVRRSYRGCVIVAYVLRSVPVHPWTLSCKARIRWSKNSTACPSICQIEIWLCHRMT